jgi:hypothetical protein
LLIIFGKHSIVVYQGAEAPATMALADTVAGVGCVDRDTVQYTGTDVLFLSHTGLKALAGQYKKNHCQLVACQVTLLKTLLRRYKTKLSFLGRCTAQKKVFTC